MPHEVLVVDDNLPAAREYARLIRKGTSVDAIAVDNATAAQEALKTDPIKIVVLDQKMPMKKGTLLYKDLKAIDSRIKVMMLSGEADTQELDEAMKLGYDDYLHKSRIKELPSKVHVLYVKYETDLLVAPDTGAMTHILTTYIGLWPFRERVEYYLADPNVITAEYVFEESWHTLKQISAGETITETDTFEVDSQFKYQTSIEAKAGQSGAVTAGHIVKLQSKIEATLTTKFSNETSIGTKRTLEMKREYKLPEAPSNPSELHVAARHFQRAPVYREIRTLVVQRCSVCGRTNSFPLVVYQPTTRIATRHVDFLSDGSERILLTGSEKF
jgi:DNA-binding response OmpR family regulator